MTTNKHVSLVKKLKELQQDHMWKCASTLALTLGDNNQRAVDMACISKAAYHAGAVRAIQDALFAHDV